MRRGERDEARWRRRFRVTRTGLRLLDAGSASSRRVPRPGVAHALAERIVRAALAAAEWLVDLAVDARRVKLQRYRARRRLVAAHRRYRNRELERAVDDVHHIVVGAERDVGDLRARA